MMQSIRITAKMQDGRVASVDTWLPLDSILAAEWMRRNHPDAYYNPSSHMLTNDFIVAKLPFERRGQGDNWYWACSFNTQPPLSEYVMHWHKRFDDHLEKYIDFNSRRGSVNIKSGKYRAYRMPLVVQLFDRLTWYAVGDMALVRDLCSAVTNLGKKTSQGLGMVDYWEVEPWPEDWSEIANGKLTRGIPAENGLPEGVQKSGVALYGIRPPYWMREHQKICYMPNMPGVQG